MCVLGRGCREPRNQTVHPVCNGNHFKPTGAIAPPVPAPMSAALRQHFAIGSSQKQQQQPCSPMHNPKFIARGSVCLPPPWKTHLSANHHPTRGRSANTKEALSATGPEAQEAVHLVQEPKQIHKAPPKSVTSFRPLELWVRWKL